MPPSDVCESSCDDRPYGHFVYVGAMEGAHDLGGVGGFGSVRAADGDVSHTEDWELRAQYLALINAGGTRPWIERIDPATYLSSSYYARWLLAGERAVVQRGFLTVDELAAWNERMTAGEDPPIVHNEAAVAKIERLMSTPEPMTPAEAPRFAIGDAVVPRRRYEPDIHHRVPRYIRGVIGVVERICGNDRLAGYRPYEVVEPVYTVRFESEDLWGKQPDEPHFAVHVDLWQSYLEPA